MVKKIKLLKFFESLSFQQKFVTLIFTFILLMVVHAFFTGSFVTYSEKDSRVARKLAQSERAAFESFEGFTITQILMEAKPNKGWLINFSFLYNNTKEQLSDKLAERGWQKLAAGENGQSSDSSVTVFCKEGVVLKINREENSNYMQMNYQRGCKLFCVKAQEQLNSGEALYLPFRC